MSACPLQSVLADFEDACKSLDDKDGVREIMLVADSLRLGGAILGKMILYLLIYSSKHKVLRIIPHECMFEFGFQVNTQIC